MARSRLNELTAEDKELLSSLARLDCYKPLLKVLNRLVEDQAEAVLDLDLLISSDRELAFRKSRMEGARKLVLDLHTVLEKLAKSNSKPD